MQKLLKGVQLNANGIVLTNIYSSVLSTIHRDFLMHNVGKAYAMCLVDIPANREGRAHTKVAIGILNQHERSYLW